MKFLVMMIVLLNIGAFFQYVQGQQTYEGIEDDVDEDNPSEGEEHIEDDTDDNETSEDPKEQEEIFELLPKEDWDLDDSRPTLTPVNKKDDSSTEPTEDEWLESLFLTTEPPLDQRDGSSTEYPPDQGHDSSTEYPPDQWHDSSSEAPLDPSYASSTEPPLDQRYDFDLPAQTPVDPRYDFDLSAQTPVDPGYDFGFPAHSPRDPSYSDNDVGSRPWLGNSDNSDPVKSYSRVQTEIHEDYFAHIQVKKTPPQGIMMIDRS